MNPKVFILVLNWNRKDLTEKCLRSLSETNYDNYEILVIDNGSTDGTEAMVRQEFPKVTLLQNGENLGYAEGNNRGIKLALDRGAEYIILVNNDSFLHSDCISQLVLTAQKNPDYGILGPLAFEPNSWEAPMSSGFNLDWKTKWVWPLKWGSSSEIVSSAQSIVPFDLVQGDAFFVSRKVFEKIGLFDSRFFLLFEEFDFCIRAKKEGFQIGIVRNAQHQRMTSGTLANNKYRYRYYDTRSLLLFLLKNSGLKNKREVLFDFIKRSKWDIEDRMFEEITKDIKHFFDFLYSLIPAFHGCFDFLIGKFGRL